MILYGDKMFGDNEIMHYTDATNGKCDYCFWSLWVFSGLEKIGVFWIIGKFGIWCEIEMMWVFWDVLGRLGLFRNKIELFV